MHLYFISLLFCIRLKYTLSQSFFPFGSYEYYWSIVQEDYVESYSEAKEQCSQMNATLAIINTREIGKFINNEIGTVPCEFFL